MGKPKVLEPNKCDELLWANVRKLPSNTIPVIKQVISNLDKNIKYDDTGFEIELKAAL